MIREIQLYVQRELRKTKNRLEYQDLPEPRRAGLMGEVRAYNDVIRFIDAKLKKEERKDEREDRELARLLHTP